jgi:hypothetical protein
MQAQRLGSVAAVDNRRDAVKGVTGAGVETLPSNAARLLFKFMVEEIGKR